MSDQSKNILVTGGAGYIGSHTAKLLYQEGFNVIIFDNLSTGFKELAKYGTFIKGDLANTADLNSVFSTYCIDYVIHFAASAYVGESIHNPQKYYNNNVVNTLNLLDTMLTYNIKKIVFSSSCAVYGNPEYLPMDEMHPKTPINPYGKTKLMIEQILHDYDKAYNVKSVILRYFNAAGADSTAELGEMHNPETHIIPLILQTALGQRKAIDIFGNTYNTKDGTCIRDFIHVEDLAYAHLQATKYLINAEASNEFNLGTQTGYSILELITAVQNHLEKEIPYNIQAKREGDPDQLIADATKAKTVLQWEPKQSDLNTILDSALTFMSKHLNKGKE